MKKYIKSAIAVSLLNSLLSANTLAATYKVEPITELTSHKYSYGQKQNGNAQEFMLSASQSYDFPVIFDYLSAQDAIDIYNSSVTSSGFVFGLEPIADVESFFAGSPSGNDLAWVVRFLQGKANDYSYQKVNEPAAFYDLGSGSEQLTIWDQPFSLQHPQLTRSTQDFLAGITTNGWFYGSGSAPYLPFTYSEEVADEDGNLVTVNQVRWIRDFDQKAFVSLDMGQTIQAVESPFSLYGGISAILDMAEVNGQQTAVGYASVGYSSFILALIENDGSGLDDNTNGILDPEEVVGCASFNEVEQQRCIMENRASLYHNNAYKWVFDDNGNIIDQEILGLLITPHVDDIRIHDSVALDINSAGVAVGHSKGWRNNEETNPLPLESVGDFAVAYKDGEIIDLTPIHREILESKATAINENGIAVGYATKLVNGYYRKKFFYVDTNNEEYPVTFPEDFFTGSSSQATAINDNGLIVGEGEIERHSNSGELSPTSNPRRRNAFLYDINTDTFTNLNDFIACDADVEIVEAKSINNLNEITATALSSVPRKNAKGELVLDDNGQTLYEDVLQAVKLTPIDGGTISDCEAKEGELIERKGASMSWFALCLLACFSLLRRQRH